jgi:hypothetical protein
MNKALVLQMAQRKTPHGQMNSQWLERHSSDQQPCAALIPLIRLDGNCHHHHHGDGDSPSSRAAQRDSRASQAIQRVPSPLFATTWQTGQQR